MDEHGTWLHVPAGTVARRGHEPPRRLETGFVMCVPPAAWWLVEFYWYHPQRAVYVNIGTPPVWHGSWVSQVDLDLDVVRNLDGSVVTLDEDELIVNQRQLGYPAELIMRARAAANLAARMLRANEEPFAGAASRWIETARQR